MKRILILVTLLISISSYSQGFFNITYSGSFLRLGDKNLFEVPIGMQVAYKQKDNIGIYTSFKMSPGFDTYDRYINTNVYKSEDSYKGVVSDYMLFNIGVNDYVFENIGIFMGFGLAAVSEYDYYETDQVGIGHGGEYYLPRDKMIRKFNLNLGAFYKITDMFLVQLEYDLAISGFSAGIGISLPDLFSISIKDLYDNNEVYQVQEEYEVLEE